MNVNLVNVPLSPRDPRCRWAADLPPADIEVWEDGVPQKISLYSRAADSPLSITVIITVIADIADTSGLQRQFLNEHRRDLHGFLKTVMTQPDQTMLVCFGSAVRLAILGSNDPAEHPDHALKDFKN